MKLHLPKLLCAALMGVLALPAMGNTLTNIAPEGSEYQQLDVGGGDIWSRPAENVVNYTGDITLNSGDALGYFSEGKLVSYDNGSYCTMHLVTNKIPVVNPETGRTTYTTVGTELQYNSGNKEFSNILDVEGTVYINGTATVQLGGQYKVQKRTDYVDDEGNVTKTFSPTSYLDDYSGLRADNVVVTGTGTGTHLHSTAAFIGNLTVNSGTVTFHTDQYNGNSTGQAFWNDGTSFKVTQIETSLTQNGGSITMGRTKSDYSSVSTSHINNVFGTKDIAASITQNAGTLSVIGYSYARTGLSIVQDAGSMTFRDVLLFSGAGLNTIEQTGSGTMVFGRLDSSARVDFDITQSGDGTIKLTGGTSLGRAYVDGVYVNSLVDITQSGNGFIEIGGGNGITADKYPIKNFGNRYTTYSIEQTGAGTITIKADATITANMLNVGEEATLDIDGSLTVTGPTTLSGTVEVAESATFILDGTTTVIGNSSLVGDVAVGANGTLILEEVSNLSVNSVLSMSEGNSMIFKIADAEESDAAITMKENGNLEFAGGSIQLELSDVAIQEMIVGATEVGTEYTLTLIENLTAEDMLELETAIGSGALTLEDYEWSSVATYAINSDSQFVTIQSSGLVLADNSLQAVVTATVNSVPEPATATLSLLALAALAARRRRR